MTTDPKPLKPALTFEYCTWCGLAILGDAPDTYGVNFVVHEEGRPVQHNVPGLFHGHCCSDASDRARKDYMKGTTSMSEDEKPARELPAIDMPNGKVQPAFVFTRPGGGFQHYEAMHVDDLSAVLAVLSDDARAEALRRVRVAARGVGVEMKQPGDGSEGTK